MAMEKDIKNISSAVMLFSSMSVSYFVYYFITGEESFYEGFKTIFSTKLMYFCLGLELISFVIARINYEKNGNNITSINVMMFLSLLIVPVISFYLTGPLGFKDTIEINYSDQLEMWLFILLMAIILSGFFIGKFKGHINNWLLLILTPISLSFTMFMTTKMMQMHDGYLVYGTIGLVNCLIFSVVAIYKKEIKNVNRSHKGHFALMAIPAVVFVPFNAIAVKIIAVEFVTLLKRVSQILTGIIVDRIHGNKETVNKKDRIIIILIFILAFGLYYYRA